MKKDENEIKEIKLKKKIKEIKSDKEVKGVGEKLELEKRIISEDDFRDFESGFSDSSRGPSLIQSENSLDNLGGGISGFENVSGGQSSSRNGGEDFKYNIGGGGEGEENKYIDSSHASVKMERVDENIGRDFNPAQTREVSMMSSQETFDSPMQEKYMDAERIDAVNIGSEKPRVRLGEVERKYEVK